MGYKAQGAPKHLIAKTYYYTSDTLLSLFVEITF